MKGDQHLTITIILLESQSLVIVAADVVSFAATFFSESSSIAHAVAPPPKTGPACAGLRFCFVRNGSWNADWRLAVSTIPAAGPKHPPPGFPDGCCEDGCCLAMGAML